MTHPIDTPENMAKLAKLADTPMTEKVISRTGPPACQICGAAIGACGHTGGVDAAADVIMDSAASMWANKR